MKKIEATQTSSNEKSTTNINSKKLGKVKRMFLLLANGARLHRFIAEKYGDHCLPTTIATLQKHSGVYFDRKTIEVPNRFGSTSRVTLYWLQGENLQRARKLLGIDKDAA